MRHVMYQQIRQLHLLFEPFYLIWSLNREINCSCVSDNNATCPKIISNIRPFFLHITHPPNTPIVSFNLCSNVGAESDNSHNSTFNPSVYSVAISPNPPLQHQRNTSTKFLCLNLTRILRCLTKVLRFSFETLSNYFSILTWSPFLRIPL